MKLAVLLLSAAAALAQTSSSKPAAKPAPAKPQSAAPQSPAPDDGTLDGALYTSDYFGFSYTIPEFLEVNEDFMQGQEDASRRSFVLLALEGAAAQAGYQDVLVLSADRNVYPNVKTAADYLAKTTREHFQPRGFEVIAPARNITLGGRTFSRIDYRKGEIYQTVIAGLMRGYIVMFTLAAPSSDELERMVGSLNTLKFRG
ncbi:MAG: hypothetical protein ACE14L_11070 [Terriglobales bacterium]